MSGSKVGKPGLFLVHWNIEVGRREARGKKGAAEKAFIPIVATHCPTITAQHTYIQVTKSCGFQKTSAHARYMKEDSFCS